MAMSELDYYLRLLDCDSKRELARRVGELIKQRPHPSYVEVSDFLRSQGNDQDVAMVVGQFMAGALFERQMNELLWWSLVGFEARRCMPDQLSECLVGEMNRFLDRAAEFKPLPETPELH